MMQNYQTPCYTLTETMEILSLRQSELQHAIRDNNLKAVLYTKPRSMLLFRRDDQSQWIGAATCTYRGHLSLHPNAIATLLDEPSLKLGTGSCTLLESDGITNWSIVYPYHRQPPHGPIIDWQPIGQEQAIAQSRAIAQRQFESQNRPIGQSGPIGQIPVPLYFCAATPFPKEIEPAIKAINKWMENYLATKQFEPTFGKTKNVDILELEFQSNSTFNQSDLRIPASEIERYKAQKAEAERLSKISVAMTPQTGSEPGKRVSQINVLVDRILDHNPQIGAKEAWRLIQEDFARDDKLFDHDQIVQAIDLDCIEWRSRYGNESSVKWASFGPLLTKLKNKRKS